MQGHISIALKSQAAIMRSDLVKFDIPDCFWEMSRSRRRALKNDKLSQHTLWQQVSSTRIYPQQTSENASPLIDN